MDAAVQALSAKGVKAFGQAVDVADGDSLKNFVAAAAEALGGLDTVVSNVSGGNGPGEQGWIGHFNHDVLGTVRLVEAAKPHLEKSQNGSIVMISTTAALEKFMQAGPYNALKGALLQYSGALSQDLAAKNIRVNAVSPGPIMIEGGSWDRIKQGMTAFYDSIVKDIPAGRMGTAREVADTVVFLASPRAAFTTGTNVVVDGGFTKRIQY